MTPPDEPSRLDQPDLFAAPALDLSPGPEESPEALSDTSRLEDDDRPVPPIGDVVVKLAEELVWKLSNPTMYSSGAEHALLDLLQLVDAGLVELDPDLLERVRGWVH